MNERFGLIMLVAAAASGQKIETQHSDRARITTLATALNHVSVIELAEDVEEVAVGSSTYKVEWRDKRVFVKPLESGSQTNLFVWTKSGRLSYELVTSPVERMNFAIDQVAASPADAEPAPTQPAPPPRAESLPVEMLLRSTPVRLVGAPPSRTGKGVEVRVTDIYRAEGRLYLRYQLRNQGPFVYHAAPPAIYSLASPKTSQSLVPIRLSQLAGSHLSRLSAAAEVAVPVVQADLGSEIIAPGEVGIGLVAFEAPLPHSSADAKTVVKLEFRRHKNEQVVAYLVL